MEHASLDRILRRADDLSHLGDRLFMIVDEIDDLALRRRELGQAPPQNGALVLLVNDRLGAFRVVGNAAQDIVVERSIGTPAQCGQRLVSGDREYPGGNLRPPSEAPSVLPYVEKRVAREVLGGSRVVHDP